MSTQKKNLTIAVDFDGTLATYDKWVSVEHCGDPIPSMVARVKAAHAAGHAIVIFTARAAARIDGSHKVAVHFVTKWCDKYLGFRPLVTAIKLPEIDLIWDDKAVGVEKNTGRFLSPAGWEP